MPAVELQAPPAHSQARRVRPAWAEQQRLPERLPVPVGLVVCRMSQVQQAAREGGRKVKQRRMSWGETVR